LNTSKRQSKRKRLIWIWMLVVIMFTPLLPVQQATVQAADYMVWKSVGTEGFATAGSNGLSMAIDSQDTPYVVYSNNSNPSNGKASVMRYNGTDWELVGSSEFSDGRAYYPSIAFDSDDTPYVVYQDAGDLNKATVKRYVGSDWATVGNPGFTEGNALVTSIALDSDNIPYVAYWDSAISKLSVKRYNGTDWVTVGVRGISEGSVDDIQIAFDRYDTPYVAFVDNGVSPGKARVMTFNGSEWEPLGGLGFSEGRAWFTSMALDSNGNPYVVYDDYAHSNKATVMKYDGSNWVVVGTPGFTSPKFPSYIYTWIALDRNDVPYIVYRDGDNEGKATVMKYDGSNWVVVGTPGISASTADTIKIAIDSNGAPYVYYREPNNSNKLFVKKFLHQPAYAASASAASTTPTTGADNEITLSVKNSAGFTDKTFNGAHSVTVSIYAQAPDGSYGSFSGTELTAGPNTFSLTFANGVATASLKLNKAGAQTIGFSVADVVTPDTNAVNITPIAVSAASMVLTTDITAPTSNGGVFAQQPVVTLYDAYGNLSTGNNSTVVTVSKKDSGAWTLTGTTTVTANAGVATFNNLAATNAAEVTGAQLAFDVSGLTQMTSQTVTFPWPVVTAPSVESVIAGDSRVQLAWSGVYGSVSYAVYQGTASGTYGDAIAMVTGAVYEYDAIGLTNGTTYYFTVKAMNPSGISVASNEVSATPQVAAPGAPILNSATAGDRQIRLSWSPVVGSTGYKVFKSTTPGGYDGLEEVSVSDSVYSYDVTGLTNGVLYYFVVKATNPGGDSAASNEVSATPRAVTTPESTTEQTSVPPQQTPIAPEPTPESMVHVFNRSIVNEADLVRTMASKAEEAKGAKDAIDFADTQGHWAEETIDTFVQLKLINGYEDGTFRPNNPITRAEFAAILNRVFPIQGGSTSKVLKDIDGTWAKDDIENLVAAGVISGYPDDTFRPNQTITREEMVVMLSRIVNLNGLEKDPAKGQFNDLNGAYAAEEIEAAAQASIVSGKGNGSFDPKNNATRAEALQIILNVLKLNPELKTLLESLS
jgi:hypothetical protein